MRASRIAAALVLAQPALALACATCVSSPFGDRTFNWAHLLLLLAPFGIGSVVGGILAYRYYWQRTKETT